MFLCRLNQDQRKSFLALATKMAMADGRIAVQEVSFLEGLTELFGQDMDVPAEEVFGAINTAPFQTRASRVITLTGMFIVAFIDEHLHIDESSVLREAIEAFGFSEDEIQRIRDCAREEARLINELDAIIQDL